mmetsp:Transcript_373/g.788  ORF Transcript_373/g.788 Transcript_373/m.788 type:complete len:144 (+) Transcript_373:102-533(+)
MMKRTWSTISYRCFPNLRFEKLYVFDGYPLIFPCFRCTDPDYLCIFGAVDRDCLVPPAQRLFYAPGFLIDIFKKDPFFCVKGRLNMNGILYWTSWAPINFDLFDPYGSQECCFIEYFRSRYASPKCIRITVKASIKVKVSPRF